MIKERPLKRAQDIILRLLLEDQEAVLDLTCDYRVSLWIRYDDERYGKTRLQLMIDMDHKRPVFSLLRYHVVTLQVLAKTAMGKNSQNQSRLISLMPIHRLLHNLLDLDRHHDGTREQLVGSDTARYVRVGWLAFLTHVHLDCRLSADEAGAFKQLISSKRIFGDGKYKHHNNLVHYFTESLIEARKRLKLVPNPKMIHSTEALLGYADEFGDNLGTHIHEVDEIMSAAHALFSKWDNGNLSSIATESNRGAEQATQLLNAAIDLYPLLALFKFHKLSKRLVALVMKMKGQGIKGNQLQAIPDEDEDEQPLPSQERYFQEGWNRFRDFISLQFDVDFAEGQTMNKAIKDISFLFGNKESLQNQDFRALKEFIKLLCHPDCDDMLKLTGVKALRAMIYMRPGQSNWKTRHPVHMVKQKQDSEYERFLRNQEPSDLGSPDLLDFQVKMAVSRAQNLPQSQSRANLSI